MDEIRLIDTLIGLVLILFGWVSRIMWTALRDLQKSDTKLAEKVSSIEVLVAGNYVKKEDFDKLGEAIFKKLDRIEDKLSEKVDKRYSNA